MFRRLLLTVACLGISTVAAAKEGAPTVITVKKMCPSCAKKINQGLAKVAGAAAASNDLESRTYTVTPKPGAVLSPRDVWAAVRKGGEVPTRLDGPSGSFSEEPPR